MSDDSDHEFDYGDFKASPETGDVKVISELVARANDIQKGLKKLAIRETVGKQLLKDLLENQIPDLMTRAGVTELVVAGGIKVKIKPHDFAAIPSLSTIEKEEDPHLRDALLARRRAALSLIEEKAPTLIKRSYAIDFEREDTDKALALERKLDETGVKYDKGETVHHKTLSKWVSEYKAEGGNLTQAEGEILSVFTKTIAKITE